MISYISGKIKRKTAELLFLEVNDIVYEVLIPKAIMNVLENDFSEGASLDLVTYHYLHVEPSRSKPILIGFLNEIEKELLILLEQFDNLCRRGCIIYDPINFRYLIVKNKDAFVLFDNLEKKSKEIEEFLREKLSPMLFPKTGDKRFSLK